MITHLTISNFQSLARVTLDLGSWTSIVGESDIGKSAVWRALHAALTNRSGDSFIRHDEKMCEVTLTFADGTRIDWQKARGKSGVYQLTPAGSAEITRYEQTNGEVPAAVRPLLNVSTDVAGEALTPGLQSQHDRAFLLADTPRRRAQVLGEFDGSNIALAAETLLRTGQRTAQTTLRAAEQQAEAATAALAAYDGLPAALAALEAAERLDEDVTARTARVERLRGLLQGVRVALTRAEGYSATAARLTLPPGLPTVEAIGQVLYTKYVYLFQASGLVLLVAMIGAIIMAKKGIMGPEAESLKESK